MIIDRAAVRRHLADPDAGQWALRISADRVPFAELVKAVDAAVDDYEQAWERDQPLVRDDEPLPVPVVISAPLKPDVILTVDKLSDTDISFTRLADVLAARLPHDARLGLLKPSKPAGSNDHDVVALLEVRIALNAEDQAVTWDVDPADQQAVNAEAAAWLRGVGPVRTSHVMLPNGKFAPIPADDELATFQTRLAEIDSAHLVSMFGTRFRKIDASATSAHLSLVTGDTNPDSFDLHSALADLAAGLERLEPLTHTALVRYDSTTSNCCLGAHMRRNVDFLVRRNALSPTRERDLEQHGVVDAQGIVYVTNPPPGIDPAWIQEPFGHLTQITAPNLDDWLTRVPTQETIDAGRRALAPLLTE